MILKTQWIRGLAFALALLALPLALVVSIAVFPNWAAHSRLQVTPFSWYNVDGELTSFRGSQAPFTLLFIGFFYRFFVLRLGLSCAFGQSGEYCPSA